MRRRGGFEGEGRGGYERKKRKNAVRDFAPVSSQPQPTNGGPVVGLYKMALAAIGAREIVS